jgi:hypothetical protein
MHLNPRSPSPPEPAPHPPPNNFDEQHTPLPTESDDDGPLPYNSDNKVPPQSGDGELDEERPDPFDSFDHTHPDTDEPIVIPEFLESLRFAQIVKDITLESQLSLEDIAALRNPRAHSSTRADNEDLLLSTAQGDALDRGEGWEANKNHRR